MNKVEKLLGEILAELKKMNDRADLQMSDVSGRAGKADDMMSAVTKIIEGMGGVPK